MTTTRGSSSGRTSPTERRASLPWCGGYRLALSEAQQLPEIVSEVIAGCHRSVARKAATGIPALVRMEREGVLDVLTGQLQAAQQLRPLIQEAVLAGIPPFAKKAEA